MDAFPTRTGVFMIHPAKTVYIGIALLSVLGSIILLSFLVTFQNVFSLEGALSTASPAGILAVFAILLFGGMYLFNIAIRIIKSVME